ncbi:MAG: nucleotidyltransferase domain-containing protein [Lachnospiraceae bacterium]|nr:nucleotidyltransferase domain-containing protein [Lachnospiraceae bacterium]
MISSDILKTAAYDFIQSNEHLGKHVILLGLAGSYSYGTNNEKSDIDVRGVALNRKSDLIGLTSFEQYVDAQTDTVIYSFMKMLTLLLSCNPNTIELLGLNPEHYLYLHPLGQELIDNAHLFLSKRAIHSFGGYADAQLRRLQNALARDSYPQSEKEQHIFNSVKNAMYDFRKRYAPFENGAVHIYTDKAVNPDFEREIFVDANLTHYPLRDYKNMWNEMNNIVKDYDKLGKRNRKKDDNHLNKHAMHLIRLFMMAIDILEKGEIRTCRQKEHRLLMDIRNGCYQKADGTFREDFYALLNDYEQKLDAAARHTSLPDEPDMARVQEYVMAVNEKAVRDEGLYSPVFL